MKIHPTAIVADGAKLADDVEIGPYSIISAESEIGAGCVIGAHVLLEHRVVLGARNRVGHGAILGANPQDLGFDISRGDTGVRIGNDNVIREYVTIHRGTKEGGDTVVGDGNFFMTGFHAGHDSVIGNRVIAANNVLLGGHVKVEDRAFLGGGSVFHQFLRIGSLCMVRGGCRFSKDIPPILLATGENEVVGLNSIGLRRRGFSSETLLQLKRAYRLLYRSDLNVSQAVERIKAEFELTPEIANILRFIESADRGILH